MEVIFYWYMLFALTTSIASLYELISPVMGALEKLEPNNVIIENKKLAYITFFLFGIMVAPLLLFSTIIPSFGMRFRNALLGSLKQDKKI
jgi:hypothetical protein